jgi:hypothetical protein
MKNKTLLTLITGLGLYTSALAQITSPVWGTDILGYHKIISDPKDGSILPWYSPDPGKSYDFVVNAVWNFWFTMRSDKNGLPYYMNHQVWRGDFNDNRGVGGDQFAMALSSWNLYYAYSGNGAVKEEMKFIADYYITHSLSPKDARWPNIPYPYNTLIYSGIYDGDMVIGKDYTQPDKAGSFGLELINLFKIIGTAGHGQTPTGIYLETAVNIANTLAKHTVVGDESISPLPFKVNAITGEPGSLLSNSGDGSNATQSIYTSNWSGTLELFLELIKMNKGDVNLYQQAFDKILSWMKKYPLKNNKWGPFFEDIPGWSDTQINAITFAQFMMNHQEYFPEWKNEVKGIFSWVYEKLGNKQWEKFGVIAVNEQTAYRIPGNSHSSRQASAELQYAALTGDHTFIKSAVRLLNWATYMVNNDGTNCYPFNEIWMTDGYGDYIRHYLRAMAFCNELAPDDQNHLLSSTSIVQLIEYRWDINKLSVPEVPSNTAKIAIVNYRTFDKKSIETLRMSAKPSGVRLNRKDLPESDDSQTEGWSWKPLLTGGILTIRHTTSNNIVVLGNN